MRRSGEKILRHVVRCDWRCKHCADIFGSERVSHYGVGLPDLVKPTWFFASMGLLDHLRDCVGRDFSEELQAKYGGDFLNHATIYDWFNQHATVERSYLKEEEVN